MPNTHLWPHQSPSPAQEEQRTQKVCKGDEYKDGFYTPLTEKEAKVLKEKIRDQYRAELHPYHVNDNRWTHRIGRALIGDGALEPAAP